MNRTIRRAAGSLLALLLLGGSAAAGQDARSAYQAGAAAQGREDYALAVEQFKNALASNPSYLEPMVGLAECYFQLEEYDEASTWISKARTFDSTDPALAVLEGRIRIGQGAIEAARALFSGVLRSQPNNVEARLGMAEADVAEGRPRTAQQEYGQTLKLAPESTRAILSLAMLSEESGDLTAAGSYYELALRSHASDPGVQLAAARWYASRGDLALAERHAKIALTLQPGMARANVLLGGIYLQGARYADAIAVLRDVVAANRDAPLAWYALGLAYLRSGDAAKAISSYASALQARPDDEVARLGEEAVAIESLPMSDVQRHAMAAYHFAQGQAFEERAYLDKALAEYRRALILDPTYGDARIGFARIYRIKGFPAKYQSELQVLAKLGTKSTMVSDEIERLSSALAESVSRSWGYDQYNLERERYRIPVYTLPSSNRLVHTLASDDLARYYATLLGGHDSITSPEVTPTVAGFDQAFRSARTAGDDYFILLTIDEAERSFSAVADLYLARTGGRIASLAAFRTGNDRVRDALLKLASEVADQLSVRGTLLTRRFGQGVIDLGSFQGVAKGDRLVIVRKGGVRLRTDGPGLRYNEKDAIGDFVVTGLDEAVSEGSVTPRGYFDYVNQGDEVVYPLKTPPAPSVSPGQRSGNLLQRLFGIRG